MNLAWTFCSFKERYLLWQRTSKLSDSFPVNGTIGGECSAFQVLFSFEKWDKKIKGRGCYVV